MDRVAMPATRESGHEKTAPTEKASQPRYVFPKQLQAGRLGEGAGGRWEPKERWSPLRLALLSESPPGQERTLKRDFPRANAGRMTRQASDIAAPQRHGLRGSPYDGAGFTGSRWRVW